MQAGTDTRDYRFAACGFSLVELLVSIAVVSILLSITLPMLQGAKKSALDSARMRLHHHFIAAVYMYGIDFDDSFPYLAEDPKVDRFVLDGWALRFPVNYFSKMRDYWPSVVVGSYLDFVDSVAGGPPVMMRDGGEGFVRFIGDEPPAQQPPFITTFFWMTQATAANPEYFAAGGVPPVDHLGLLRAQRLSDVRYTSKKGLFLDMASGAFIGAGGGDKRTSVGMVDGSAGWRPLRVVDGHRGVEWTRQGVYGRDF